MSFFANNVRGGVPPATRIALAIAVLAGLAVADAVAGGRMPFTVLYVLPVAAAAWQAGRHAGIVVASVAAGVRLGVEILAVGLDGVTVWNGVVWTMAFLSVAQLVVLVRDRQNAAEALALRVGELEQIEYGSPRTDPLTALCNRRAFVDSVQRAEARSRRNANSLAIVRIDLDRFESVNRVYSRSEGDQLLRSVATSLALTTRMGDLASRLGDDEFALLLYGCSPDDSVRVGQRIVDEIAELGRTYPNARVTASVGIASVSSAGPDSDELLRLAGAALRRAKEAGGNTVLIEREWTPDWSREFGAALEAPPA